MSARMIGIEGQHALAQHFGLPATIFFDVDLGQRHVWQPVGGPLAIGAGNGPLFA